VSVKHTSYLPILVPRDNMSTTSTDDHKRRADAESWAEASIGPDALFSIKQDAGSVIDINDVSNIPASRAHDALQRLMTRAFDARRRLAESLRETQTASDCNTSHLFRTAVTGGLLAIVAILLVRLCVPAKQLPTPASQPSSTGRASIFPVANKSSSPVASNSAALVPSSLKDFALAVFNPVPSSPRASPSPPAKQGPSTSRANTDTEKKELESGDGKLMTWSERVKSSKDLILPGSSSLSFEARSKKALSLIVPQHTTTPPEEPPSALSIRLIDSLSQIFDVRALSEVVRHDMKELSDALDQLMIVIGKQTAAIMEESKGTSKVLRERLEQRHGKAKVRARQLKGQLGGQLLTYVGGEIKCRAEQAKGKARQMAETLVLSEAWNVHRKKVEEHRKRMEANSIDRQKRREARRARQARRGKNDGKKGRGIFSRA